ncbi:hypothetical protein BKA65DRAFT_58743 [Rhexocercosporidium sp. MPI-PUGE-AT-0058]|nr:hypothetical protein BKA65DRAFT_58743 [Rhexocercosporidium sp. MPI-PUGE-AT-0058]
MSNKNRSKKSSTKIQHAEEVRRKIVKDSGRKVEVIVERKADASECTSKPTLAPTSVQKETDVSAAKPKVEGTPWSDWAWDDTSGRWWRARLGADKNWQYECTEPTGPALIPSPIMQFAPAAKYEYPEQRSKILFTNEVMYQVPDSRGGYFLAVTQEEQSWNLEEALNWTKAKEVTKKVDVAVEKKEGGAEKKVAVPSRDAASQEPSAGEKPPAKANVEPAGAKQAIEASSTKKTVGIERVREWMAEVNDAVQKAEGGPGPSPIKREALGKDRKSKTSSKLKNKTVFIEEEDDDDDELRHRGRTRQRR